MGQKIYNGPISWLEVYKESRKNTAIKRGNKMLEQEDSMECDFGGNANDYCKKKIT